MEQLAHLIDDTFSDVEKFELFRHHRCTLQSLYAALDHQLQDGLMVQHKYDRMRYVVRKLFDLKLHMRAIEAEPSLLPPADDVEHAIALTLNLYSEGILSRPLFIRVCTRLL